MHLADKSRKIGQKYIAIDISQYKIECAVEGVDNARVAQKRRETIVYTINDCIVAGIVYTPLVDIVADGLGGAKLEGGDREDAGAGAAIQNSVECGMWNV